MGKKPNFKQRSGKTANVSQVLAQGASNAQRKPKPLPVEEAPALQVAEQEVRHVPRKTIQKPRSKVATQKRKLSHMKILLEYGEKKEISGLLDRIGDELGHTVQFSIFARALLIAVLSQEKELIEAAQEIAHIERPSNSEVEALREYETYIGQMIHDALGFRGSAKVRG